MSLSEKAGKFVLAVGLVTVMASLSFTLVGLIGAGVPFSALSFLDFGLIWLGYIPLMVPVVTIAGVLALPIAAAMEKSGRPGMWGYAAAGAIAGVLASTALLWRLALTGPNIAAWGAVGLLPGIAAGLFWWQTVVRRERAERGLAA
ncbi:MAG: hypothetical protein ACTHM8_07080 [Sphingomonas sp.]